MQNSDAKLPSDVLPKIVDLCQVLQKKHQSLEETVNDLLKENGALRVQIDKLRADLAERIETAVDHKITALEARLKNAEIRIEAAEKITVQSVTLEEVSAFVSRREEDFGKRVEAQIDQKISSLATGEDLEQTRSNVSDLESRFNKMAGKLQKWAEYRQLQEEAEFGEYISNARTPFSLLHLLHPSKSLPLVWKLRNLSNFKDLTQENICRRLYSRPFGIEKDGTVRCVLRALVVKLPNEDVLQFALEVLYATKYTRRFHFRFQILSPNKDKSMVKTFSSTQAVLPRYWFPQNELQPSGLVSFAFAVSEDQLMKDELLVDDQLLIQVGLRK